VGASPFVETAPPPELAPAPVDNPPRAPLAPPRPVASTPKPAKPPAEPRNVAPRAAPKVAALELKSAPVASSAPSPAASGALVADYQRAVVARISAVKRYPDAARERAPQGVAVVSFSIGASGQVGDVAIARSAGDAMLDAEALATVRRASPFPAPPAGAPRAFSAPLSFKVR
jgi:protein TonB